MREFERFTIEADSIEEAENIGRSWSEYLDWQRDTIEDEGVESIMELDDDHPIDYTREEIVETGALEA